MRRMRRRDALKTIAGLAGSAVVARLLPGCGIDPQLGELESEVQSDAPNFQRLSTISTRTSWTNIVRGRWTTSPYDGLLMYDRAAGTAEFFTSDGAGNLTPLITDTWWRTTWSQIVPGTYDDSGFSGLLLYDNTAGVVQMFATDGAGNLSSLLASWSTRPTWTHVVPGFFTIDNYTSVLFYDAHDGYCEVWRTNSVGCYQPSMAWSSTILGTSYTHIVSGDFLELDPYGVQQYSGLFCYNNATKIGIWYANDGTSFSYVNGQSEFPFATTVVGGNFGGYGAPDLLFYDATTGTQTFMVLFNFDGSEPWLPVQTLSTTDSGIPTDVTLIVPGHYWLVTADDQCFFDGPIDYATGDNAVERRNWALSTGGFIDLAFYAASSGTIDVYFHQPLQRLFPNPIDLAEQAYVTSTTVRNGVSRPTGSVAPGEAIYIHTSISTNYVIDIVPATALDSTTPLLTYSMGPSASQSISFTAFRDGVNWPTAKEVVIPATWTSNIYVARITAGTDKCYLPFVVRNAGTQNKVLVVVPDANDEAYNMWGGRSFYGYVTADSFVFTWPQGCRSPFALKVSFNRPYYSPLALPGLEYKWIYRVAPLVQWLQGLGIEFDMITDRDMDVGLDTNAGTLHKLLVYAGHHEYWSSGMRTNTSNFLANGNNIAFLGANTCWWQVRFADNYASMYCYRQYGFDPLLHTSPQLVTTHWYDVPVYNPEAKLTGLSWGDGTTGHVFAANRYDAQSYPNPSAPVFVCDVASNAHWMLYGSQVTPSLQFGNYRSAGDPVDSYILGSETDLQVAHSPSTWQSFASAYWQYPGGSGPERVADMGVVNPPNSSTGIVFNAGTMDWVFGLTTDTTHQGWTIPDEITLNVFTGCAGKVQAIGSQNATDVAVGANGTICALTTTPIYGGYTIVKWSGSSWTTLPGGSSRIAVDPSGNPWVVSSDTTIWRWETNVFVQVVIPSGATDIGIGATGDVWVMTATGNGTGNHYIQHWTGSGWTQIDGAGVRITVDNTGNPWMVDAAGDVFQRIGGVSGYWTSIGFGIANDIGAGPDGSIWITSSTTLADGTRTLYRLYPSATGTMRWGSSPASATAVAVGPGGVPYYVAPLVKMLG